MSHRIPTEAHLKSWNPSGDPLGRQELAKQTVKNILANMEAPNVFGVFGDWGTGKTTFLHYLQMVITGKQKDSKGEDIPIIDRDLELFRDSLKGEDLITKDLAKIEIIHFEPWRYEYAENADLLFALIKQIDTKLNIKDDKLLNAIFLASQTLRATTTSFLVNGIKTGTRDVFDIKDISKRLNSLKKDQSGSALEEYKKWDTDFNKIQDLFVGFIKKALRGKDKLLIFIDDLDRCLPENTIKLLEAIKNFLYVDSVIFALAIDANVVSEMIEQKYALHQGYGGEYLDKIINFQLILPRSEGISVIVDDTFKIHGFNISPQAQSRIVTFLGKFLPQPRKIKKILRQVLVRCLTHPNSAFSWADDEKIQYAVLAEFLASRFPSVFLRSSSESENVLKEYLQYKKKINNGSTAEASAIHNAFSQDFKDRFSEIDSIFSHLFFDATRTDYNARFDYSALVRVMLALKYIE